MTELMKKILEQSYTVPAENENDKKLYALNANISKNLTKEQGAILDQMMDVHIDLVNEASLDGFMQGFFRGLTLMSELFLHKSTVLESKQE